MLAIIDTEKLGREYRNARKGGGWDNVKEFVADMEKLTGLEMPYQTMRRIERGDKEPRISEALAIETTLNARLGEFRDYIGECVTSGNPRVSHGKHAHSGITAKRAAFADAFALGYVQGSQDAESGESYFNANTDPAESLNKATAHGMTIAKALYRSA